MLPGRLSLSHVVFLSREFRELFPKWMVHAIVSAVNFRRGNSETFQNFSCQRTRNLLLFYERYLFLCPNDVSMMFLDMFWDKEG